MSRDALVERLIQQIPESLSVIDASTLKKIEWPEPWKQWVTEGVQSWIRESFSIPDIPLAKMDAPAVHEKWKALEEVVCREWMLPREELRPLLLELLDSWMELLADPARRVPDTLFGHESELTLDQLSDRVTRLVIGQDLAVALRRYSERKGLESVTLEQASRVLAQVDQKLRESREPEGWARELAPLFALWGGSVPTRQLRELLLKRGCMRAESITRDEQVYSEEQLIRALSGDPSADREQKPAWTRPQRVSPPGWAGQGTESGTSTDLDESTDSAVPLREEVGKPLEEVPKKEHPDEDGALPDREDRTSRESKEEPEPPKSLPEEEDSPKSLAQLFGTPDPDDEPEDEPVGWFRKENESEETEGAVPFEETPEPESSPDLQSWDRSRREGEEEEGEPSGQGEELSLHQRFQFDEPTLDRYMEEHEGGKSHSQEEIGKRADRREPFNQEAGEPSGRSEEQASSVEPHAEQEELSASAGREDAATGLRRWLGREESRFLFEIFEGSKVGMDDALYDLSRMERWGDAARYLQDEVFDRYRVDLMDDAAVDFTDRMQAWFEEGISGQAKP